LAVIAVAALGLALTGCGGHHRTAASSATTIPGHVQLSGSLQLVDNTAAYEFGGPCRGGGSTSDVRAGAPVVVRDAHNAILGHTTLQAGHADSKVECVFPFVVDDIPIVASYRVALGRYGDVTLSQDQLTSAQWNVHLGLAANGAHAGNLEVQQ
jgi:hypothetical protein